MFARLLLCTKRNILCVSDQSAGVKTLCASGDGVNVQKKIYLILGVGGRFPASRRNVRTASRPEVLLHSQQLTQSKEAQSENSR